MGTRPYVDVIDTSVDVLVILDIHLIVRRVIAMRRPSVTTVMCEHGARAHHTTRLCAGVGGETATTTEEQDEIRHHLFTSELFTTTNRVQNDDFESDSNNALSYTTTTM